MQSDPTSSTSDARLATLCRWPPRQPADERRQRDAEHDREQRRARLDQQARPRESTRRRTARQFIATRTPPSAPRPSRANDERRLARASRCHSKFRVLSRLSLPDLLQLLARHRELPRIAREIDGLERFLFGLEQRPQPVVQLGVFELRPEVVGIDRRAPLRARPSTCRRRSSWRAPCRGTCAGRPTAGCCQAGLLELLDVVRQFRWRDRVRVSPGNRAECAAARGDRCGGRQRERWTWRSSLPRAPAPFGLQHEVRIAERAHFRDVQAFELGLRRARAGRRTQSMTRLNTKLNDEHEARRASRRRSAAPPAGRRRRRTAR